MNEEDVVVDMPPAMEEIQIPAVGGSTTSQGGSTHEEGGDLHSGLVSQLTITLSAHQKFSHLTFSLLNKYDLMI